MKTKLVGIFVCMLLIVTALSATGATNVQTLRYIMENNDFKPYPGTPVDSPDHIAIKIVAEVTDVNDEFNLLGGAIQAGDEITGKYIYDSETPDSNADPQIGEYEHTSSPFGIELKAGGFVFKTNSSNVEFEIIIFDNMYYYSGDLYGVFSYNNLELSNGVLVSSIAFGLFDSTGNALSSDALPTTAPVLSDWEENILFIIGTSPVDSYEIYIITANVTKVTLNRSKARDIYSTMQPILIWLFDRFPNLFPILKQLFGFQ